MFGGYSNATHQLDNILYLRPKSIKSGWIPFVHDKVPSAAGVIRGAIVNRIGSDGCDLMFAGSSAVYTCRDNFVWTSKSMLASIPIDRKAVPVAANPFRPCMRGL